MGAAGVVVVAIIAGISGPKSEGYKIDMDDI